MKPSHGLAPYTGILSLDAHLDHTGPMTASVAHNAGLLEVIVGPDGIDMRQQNARVQSYWGATLQPAEGLRVAVVEEGFPSGMDPGVEKRVRQAAAALEADGVAVRSTSIPEHPSFGSLRVPLLLLGSYELMRTTDSRRHTNLPVPCGTVDSLSAGCMLVGRHCDEATLYRLAAAVEAT